MRIDPRTQEGFTIVELLIVIVVIGILAAITLVSYNGITSQAKEVAVETAAKDAYKKVALYPVTHGEEYPPDLDTAGVDSTSNVVYQYSVDNGGAPKTFCVTAAIDSISYYVSNTSSVPTSGACPAHTVGGGIIDGAYIQIVTGTNCPTVRTRAVDARDNRTYWIQKLGDGKCWMLTNLAYSGGGVNSYGDVKVLVNGTSDPSVTYTAGRYYIPTSGSNVTTEPTAPSTSTTGTGQYGYLYNWCAAMGAQATAACANGTTPAPNTAISVCPAGWRLPTGNGGEIGALNTAANSGSTITDAGLRTTWLAQRSGNWDTGSFLNQGSFGFYWSSGLHSATSAYSLVFGASTVNSAYTTNNKYYGYAVRCVAS